MEFEAQRSSMSDTDAAGIEDPRCIPFRPLSDTSWYGELLLGFCHFCSFWGRAILRHLGTRELSSTLSPDYSARRILMNGFKVIMMQAGSLPGSRAMCAAREPCPNPLQRALSCVCVWCACVRAFNTPQASP